MIEPLEPQKKDRKEVVKALQLVSMDKNGKVSRITSSGKSELMPEAKAWLNQIVTPLTPVAAVGPKRIGKSTLLNQYSLRCL